ncbi:MAG: polysaccharide biosynthesis C-terminal domain-containing protein [Lachnospiraceae bacterium]|nr:polysaccharide biosynthesis C-terminal domain-containing protein [Lachnospiraceae bacterium]
MTEGSILGALVAFAVPMMLGGLFQDLYSMADMTIAGYTLGDHAIAAISASAAIVNMMNYAARGYNMGNSILISNAFGEGNMEKTKRALIAMIVLCVAYSAAFTALFLIFLEPLLNFVNTPAELYSDAKLYAVIIISGLTCTMFYNVFACAFRALGNSKIPLYFLIFSSLLNIALDFVCIVILRLGVMGAAIATIFSQFISAVLSGIQFFKVFPEMKFKFSDTKGIDPVVADMFPVGISVAITNSIFSIGAVSVQGAINALGSDTIIAQSACSKIRMFATIPSVNIANAVATFAAQNYGARKYKRITEGVWTGIGLSAAINVLTYLIVFFFGGRIAQLITNTKNDDVVFMASTMLRIEVLFIWAQTAVMSFRMSIQSLKRKVIPMVGTGVELVIRCVFAFVITPLIGFRAISYAEVASWLISGAVMAVCYFILINGLVSGRNRQI